MECIVHFEVVHEEKTKELRGLIFVDEGKVPGEEDFLKMFEEMGYQLRLEDRERWIFKPVDAGADYKEIRIRKLDTGDKKIAEDNNLKSIVSNLLPSQSRPL
ncbi:hypothetical protein DCC85_02800 [Paenibacillus sp. CAA11]|uniref:hypothetical protein n=1 Tax=Paenibacillus sp. CAA11 TaxID=1532905 RepID=UPI000D3ABDB3|nr:hypothetical protein [Paenibacillus sp. CAA11]AWB43262.1 hypothetical protein DCC85_02800 [Paenibacillus sp. CAA11]